MVEADMPTAREASLLTIQRTTPILRGSRTLYLSDEQVIEFSQAVYRGDRYRFETMLFERDWSLQGQGRAHSRETQGLDTTRLDQWVNEQGT